MSTTSPWQFQATMIENHMSNTIENCQNFINALWFGPFEKDRLNKSLLRDASWRADCGSAPWQETSWTGTDVCPFSLATEPIFQKFMECLRVVRNFPCFNMAVPVNWHIWIPMHCNKGTTLRFVLGDVFATTTWSTIGSVFRHVVSWIAFWLDSSSFLMKIANIKVKNTSGSKYFKVQISWFSALYSHHSEKKQCCQSGQHHFHLHPCHFPPPAQHLHDITINAVWDKVKQPELC